MSAEKITQTHYLCKCELPDCPSKGEPWTSQEERIPDRCNFCGRRTWNGSDKRRSRLITAQGKTMRQSEWAKATGVSPQLIRYRLNKGWSEEDAVGLPVEKGTMPCNQSAN